MELLITTKNVYGNELIYPACPKSKLFCELLGTKTLTRNQCLKISALGYTFRVITANQSILNGITNK